MKSSRVSLKPSPYRLLMNRFPLLLLLIYIFVFTGLVFLKGPLLALAIPLLLYVAAGFLYQPQQVRLNVERRFSAGHVSPSEPVEVTVVVTNEGPDLESVSLEDIIPEALSLLEGEARLLTALPAGESVSLQYTLAGERGAYYFPGMRLTATDRLNVFGRQETLSAPGQLLVLPAVIKLRKIEIRPRQTRVYSGLIPTQQGGPGVEFFRRTGVSTR